MKKILSLILLVALLQSNLVCLASDLSNGVQITLSQIPLCSKLKRNYNGYKYTIVNNSNQNLNLVNAQVDNAVNGSVAYRDVSDGHPLAITWAIAGPVGLFTFGLGWAAGVIASPIVWVVSESRNKRAQKESIAYPNIVNLGVINRGESIETTFLVPIGTKPQFKMTVQPEKSKELETINSL